MSAAGCFCALRRAGALETTRSEAEVDRAELNQMSDGQKSNHLLEVFFSIQTVTTEHQPDKVTRCHIPEDRRGKRSIFKIMTEGKWNTGYLFTGTHSHTLNVKILSL